LFNVADNVVVLSCTNCGAKLEIYPDVERFACGYCGTELIVLRRGGTVALKAVTDAIREVQIGTDRTAAELAIVRLSAELAELEKQRTAMASGRSGDQGCAGCSGIVAVLLFVAAVSGSGSGPSEIWLFIVGGAIACAILLSTASAKTRAMAKLDARISETKRQLADQ